MKKRLLTAAGVLLAAGVALAAYGTWQVRTTSDEEARSLPGDELISAPAGSLHHAITIHCPPEAVWPWLAQMGSGRAGWYAYDFIDNGGQPSAEAILPQFQNVEPGTVFPALPGVRNTFVVALVEPPRALVLSWRLPDGRYLTTWAFALLAAPGNATRLVVRGRAGPGYRPLGLPEWLATRLARPAHFIMQRKQLVEIARRAEAACRH